MPTPPTPSKMVNTIPKPLNTSSAVDHGGYMRPGIAVPSWKCHWPLESMKMLLGRDVGNVGGMVESSSALEYLWE